MLRCRHLRLARRRLRQGPSALRSPPTAPLSTTGNAFLSEQRQQQQQQPTTSKSGDAFAVDTLPALKVLSETFALMKQSPAFRNWNASDWLMGLTGALNAC